MKRIISILALSIFVISVAYAAPKTNNASTVKVKEDSSVVDSAKAAAPVEMTEKGESLKAASIKTSTKESVKECNSSLTSLLPIVSLIVSILALALAAVVFIFSKKKYEELYGRYLKVKNDMKNLSYEINGNLSKKIDSNGAKIDAKIIAVKEQILEEMKAVQGSRVERSEFKPVITEESEPPKFVSKTFYGIYKPKAKGVYLDQITDIRDGGSTFEIKTISDTEAVMHLVDNLSKTQFSGLMGDAVDVTEGSNPQSYDTISEVEAGRMKLSEETWTITKKILVQLS